MLKNYKLFIYLYIFLFSKAILASSSASFLISQTAFNSYDFSQVLYEYSTNQNGHYKSDYLDELISAVVTEDFRVAEKIAEKILNMDPDNQEAKLVQMSNAYNNNRLNNLNSLRLDSSKNKNELLEFLFYQNDKVKNKSKTRKKHKMRDNINILQKNFLKEQMIDKIKKFKKKRNSANNKTQKKVPIKEIVKIISLADKSGFRNIDTAVLYGKAEKTLGKIGVKNFKITSKLPYISSLEIKNIEKIIQRSLKNLKEVFTCQQGSRNHQKSIDS